MSQREVKVLKDILSANDQIAERNRQLLDSKGVLAMNIMASPGSGKTSLILETIKKLKSNIRIGVIEGDISSSLDADKIRKENIPVIQINTGGECHLDANMINRALDNMPLKDIELLLIENVGNLVCPAEFETGVHKKVILLSTPEGEDKPYKYPLMFNIADVVLINKIDLLPYLNFNIEDFSKAVKGINRDVKIFPISCTTQQGIENWISWVMANIRPSAPYHHGK